MLTIRLHPMQPQRMQELRQPLHHTQDRHRQREPQYPNHHQPNRPANSAPAKRVLDGHAPEHLGELRVRERERPETEVGRRVRDAAEAELDGVDDLVYDHFAEVVVFLGCSSLS